MALGATRTDVLGMFLRQALSLVLAGVALGLLGAFGLTRWLRALLTNISTVDPWVFALAPALRAASVDPASALRAE
jgi:putative ABC transport system permease protein